MNKILVTGGAGFIGSHFVDRLLRADDVAEVTVLDSLTYAGNMANLGTALLDPRVKFVKGCINESELVDALMNHHDTVVHFAAESHVDRSLLEADTFVRTNVFGTLTLLDAARRHNIARFVHVSTDEVYGSLPEGAATEEYPLRPSIPYAASKAASDLVALSYWRTHGVPVCVTRSSNNYGPRQHPEKVIPLFVTRLLKGEPVTLHGQGQHVRNWLHVSDNCAGIELVLRNGTPGEVYNLGGGVDLSGRELTGLLLDLCGADWTSVTHIPDRLSNDLRYAMDCTKVTALGYAPRRDLRESLAETVDWYRHNCDRRLPPHASVTAHPPFLLGAPREPQHA